MTSPSPDTTEQLRALHAESFGWAMQCCGRDRQHAADVLQTTYLKILEGRARYAGTASFRTWLFAVIRNTAASHYRARAVRRFFHPEAAEADVDERGADDSDLADEPADPREAAWLLVGLRKLSLRQREVLQLVFYHDMSILEAAAVLRISLGSARQHHERGKAALRRWLEQRGVRR